MKSKMEEGIRLEIDEGVELKQRKIRAFMEKTDFDEKCYMFDTASFNNIARAYLKITLNSLIEEKVITYEQSERVLYRMTTKFADRLAHEALKEAGYEY